MANLFLVWDIFYMWPLHLYTFVYFLVWDSFFSPVLALIPIKGSLNPTARNDILDNSVLSTWWQHYEELINHCNTILMRITLTLHLLMIVFGPWCTVACSSIAFIYIFVQYILELLQPCVEGPASVKWKSIMNFFFFFSWPALTPSSTFGMKNAKCKPGFKSHGANLKPEEETLSQQHYRCIYALSGCPLHTLGHVASWS